MKVKGSNQQQNTQLKATSEAVGQGIQFMGK